LPSTFVVRCRHCHRIALTNVPHIGERESDALVSHLKHCSPDLAAREEEWWRRELGRLLGQFDVSKTG
jgi:hypothetical protein